MSHAGLSVVTILLAAVAPSSALAETRGVAIVLKRDKEKGTLVTIHSDVKEEKQSDIPLDEAVKVVARMKGWANSVMVCIVVDQTLAWAWPMVFPRCLNCANCSRQ
jgi:hypothetical protein